MNKVTTNNKAYDLEERTSKFAEKIIIFCKKIPFNEINKPLIGQLVRSGTSIGANYCEANGASSKKDFTNKLHICLKEAKETKYWLRMTIISNPSLKNEATILWNEAYEYVRIFSISISTLKLKS